MFVSHALLIIWAPWGNILPMFVQNGEYMFNSKSYYLSLCWKEKTFKTGYMFLYPGKAPVQQLIFPNTCPQYSSFAGYRQRSVLDRRHDKAP